jgi:hypothetical protein
LRTSAAGGEEYLHATLKDSPSIIDDLTMAGVAVVTAHFLTPRPDDLQVLAALDARGFRPKATLLVLNEAHVERGADAEDAFNRIYSHSFRGDFFLLSVFWRGFHLGSSKGSEPTQVRPVELWMIAVDCDRRR